MTITGPAAYLHIDANGNPIADSGVTYTETATQIIVSPIVNNGGGQASIEESGPNSLLFAAIFGSQKKTTNSATITGNATFTYVDGRAP